MIILLNNQLFPILILIQSKLQDTPPDPRENVKKQINQYADIFTETPMSQEWKIVYQRDKGYFDHNSPESSYRKSIANDVYLVDRQWMRRYAPIYNFASPLRFCPFPNFPYNFKNYCFSEQYGRMKEVEECMNHWCKYCCGISNIMLWDMANEFSTAKFLDITNSPGWNIINQLITDDEREECKMMCNIAQHQATPIKKPMPTKIKDLGLSNAMETQGADGKLAPVVKAWSCNDINVWAEDPNSGYQQIWIIDKQYKVQCDLTNNGGGQMLIASHLDQNSSMDINEKEKIEDVEDQSELFPQFVAEEEIQGVYKLFRWKNQWNTLKLLQENKDQESIPEKQKIANVWLFCSLFKQDVKEDKIKVHTQMTMDFTDKGVIKALLTGDRTSITEDSLRAIRSQAIQEKDTKDEEDLESDMPYFYHLGKLWPFLRDEKTKNTLPLIDQNKFLFEKKKGFQHGAKFDSQGFKRDLLFGGNKLWSLKRQSDDKFDGINNCDSFLTEEEKSDQFSLHQVQVKMFTPDEDSLYQRDEVAHPNQINDNKESKRD